MAGPRPTAQVLQRVERHGTGEDVDPHAIREQVERILASPVFRNSRRHSSLLRHAVERAVEGRTEELTWNPEHLEKLARMAPKHWEQKNIQVVLAIDVIRGSSGPPTVLAAHFW